ncbi:radical SAM protein [candidate division WWE3 bacterium CG06_land_8_20_14_3_00_42_16]|uniref:Radical SAM protein n=3 Tax=Katanobacteria TaxID=422282 RepID=A0A2M7ALW8_UNCKA|nr:MAG: radical SAM protein [bacterium CG1_02_42_9]PIU68388.1 MAG: radical SAM protein [candidate division WWE3 bacterium CG06_land_8_20_14_3_00_42_16]PIZ42917.1 MAG: radical SAM protein [candidate division WWE3 bacterium CG_4_10_14_0_2_um_filter_42_8]PJC68363.1 MAG: radical SAM protein [candidate division WWE3 bacterium CG_4_8_14_3_um_filter_42_11]
MIVREIKCRQAITKCGFPGGGWAINPYVGCGHGCVYCYARFIKRFTGHTEEWGKFIDVRVNAPEILAKQIKSPKYQTGNIYLGTVTDPYQPLEGKYRITRKILEVLKDYPVRVSILTKSKLVLRDLDLLLQMKEADVSFTVNSLDDEWRKRTEPFASSVGERLEAAKSLIQKGIKVDVMLGPYWPYFTEAEMLVQKFKETGVSHLFSESFNAIGGNWNGVEKVLKRNYSELFLKMRNIILNPQEFDVFYKTAGENLCRVCQKYDLPVTTYFGSGHAGKKFTRKNQKNAEGGG